MKLSHNAGEKNPNAKLKAKNVERVFKLHKKGLSQRAIASMFDVCQTSVANVLKRRTWRHVKPTKN